MNQTPAQSVVREVFEESGYHVRAVKLAAVWDRARQAHPPAAFSVVRMFFICALEGGSAATSLETSEVGWFAEAGCAGGFVAAADVATSHQPDVRALAGAGAGDGV